jgi:hypothetical protein
MFNFFLITFGLYNVLIIATSYIYFTIKMNMITLSCLFLAFTISTCILYMQLCNYYNITQDDCNFVWLTDPITGSAIDRYYECESYKIRKR